MASPRTQAEYDQERDEEQRQPGVGALLRASRLRCGEELRDIAELLCIRYLYLEAIEAGRYQELPGTTYAIGFIRAYAEHLGLDSEEVVRRFKAEQSTLKRQDELAFPTPLPESGIPKGAIVFVGLIIAGLAYGAWYLSSSEEGGLAGLIGPLPDRLESLVAGEAPKPAEEARVEAAGDGSEPTAASPEPSVAASPDAGSPATEPAPTTEEAPAASTGTAAEISPADEAAATSETEAGSPAESAESPDQTPAPESAGTGEGNAPETVAETAAESPTAPPAEPGAAEPASAAPAPAAEAPSPAPETEAGTSASTDSETSATAADIETPATTAPAAPAPSEEPQAAAEASLAETASPPATPEMAPAPAAPPAAPAQPPATETATPAPAAETAAAAGSGSVLIRAVDNSWVQIRDTESNETVVTRLLRAGEEITVEARPGLMLSTGNAGGLEIVVDGAVVPSIGGPGTVRRNVALDSERLKAGTALP